MCVYTYIYVCIYIYFFLLSHRTPVKSLVPINCLVLTFSRVTKLYPQNAPEYIALGDLWVCPTWSSGQVAEAPERLIETSPRGCPRPAAVPVVSACGALSAPFVLSDARSSACFSLSHAFTDPAPLAAFLFHVTASDTVPVMRLHIPPISPVKWGKGRQLGHLGICMEC